MEPRAGFEPATSALPTQCFDELLNEFERFCGVDLQLSPVTVKDHSSGICRVLRRMQKEYQEVSTKDLRNYLYEFKQDHTPATVAGVIKTLRVFYRDFLDRPELVASFKFPNIPYRPKIIPSREDLQKFYNCLDSDLGEALFLFYASSGLRKNEVLSLSVKDIDFEKRLIIPNCHNGSTKNSYISFFNKEAEKALTTIQPKEGKLFQISDRQYKKVWKTAQEETGLNITAQKLREWFCCEMGSLGISDRYIDAFCGRTPKSVLARNYTVYNPVRLKETYEKANLKVLV